MTEFGFYIKQALLKLAVLPTANVDDILLASTPDMFKRFQRVSHVRFDVNFDTSDRIQYVGVAVKHVYEIRKIQEEEIIVRIRLLTKSNNYSEYVSARNQLAYMHLTRPDVSVQFQFFVEPSFALFCVPLSGQAIA